MRPGQVLANRYQLIDLLDESGGASFWRAHDRILARPVAIHVLSRDDPRATPLIDAARASATVLDRRLLRVLDAAMVGQDCYVVCEWGEGMSLDNILAVEEVVEPRRAAWMVAELGGAITAAHAAGIPHGRLLPENLLVDRTGTVRVIGLAIDAAVHGIRPAGFEGDVHDLGGLLYAALTGTWPAGTAGASLVPTARQVGDRWLRPRQVRHGIPRFLDDVCDAILNGTAHRLPWDLTTAGGVTDALVDFIGDPSGMAVDEAVRINRMQRAVRQAVLDDQDPSRPAPPSDDATQAIPAGTGDDEPGDDVQTMPVPVVRRFPPPEQTPAEGSPLPGAGAPDSAAERPAGEPEPPAAARQTFEEPSLAGGDTPPAAPEAATEDAMDTDEQAAVPPVVPPSVPPGEYGERTQAGLPIFDDDSGETDWLSTEPRKPPVLPDPEPAKPLFAPEPAEGEPIRRPREGRSEPVEDAYWPWDGSSSTSVPVIEEEPEPEPERRPGRRSLQAAVALAIIAIILVAVAFAFRLGRDGNLIGEDEPGSDPQPTRAEPTPLKDLSASDLDPFGDPPEENPDLAKLTVDGDPATAWRTQTYLDQFGDGGLKPGVGMVVDLGASFDVRQVEVTFVGAPASFDVFVTGKQPDDPSQDEPAGASDAVSDGPRQVKVDLDRPTSGRFVTIWLTALPQVDGGFRGEIGEIEISA